MRAILGTLAAVRVSLAVPGSLIILGALSTGASAEGDTFMRVTEIWMLLPALTVLLVIYHGLGYVVIRTFTRRPSVAILVIGLLTSALISALFLSMGEPLGWASIGQFAVVMISIGVLLVLGSAAQYVICFGRVKEHAV